MHQRPKVLVIGSPSGLVSDEVWQDFTFCFNVREYDFATTGAFHESLRAGDCRDVAGIVRLGLNVPPQCEKVLIGWTGRALEYLPVTLKLIVNFGHGFNDEAVDELKARGITFSNTTGGSEATAAVGIYLVISAFRQLGRYERMLRNDQFLPGLRHSAQNAVDCFGKKLGIIGMGVIGRAVGRHAHSLGMEIHCVDRPSTRKYAERSAEGHAGGHAPASSVTTHRSLIDLARSVDCILLSCPYTEATHHLLCKEIFEEMKKGVRIVNIARGLCIDEEALADAIDAGIVGGAGLDVHHDEPLVNQRLLHSECVTLLPHVGGLTHNSMAKHASMALEKAQRYFASGESRGNDGCLGGGDS